MSRSIETLIEGEQWSAKLQTVASEFELITRVNIGDQELGGGTHRTLRQPHEQVLLLSLLEEHAVVAGLLEAHLVDYVAHVLPIHLGLHLGVGNHVGQIFDQVPHSAGDSARANHESSLAILPLF